MTNHGQTNGHFSAAGDVTGLRDSFARHLRAANVSPLMVKTYLDAVDQFTRFLVAPGDLPSVSEISRAHVEAFIADQLERWRPATAANRFRGLRQFFAWLVDEEEIELSPMAKMSLPRVPDDPPAVLADDDLRALVAACEADKSIEGRRDAALSCSLECEPLVRLRPTDKARIGRRTRESDSGRTEERVVREIGAMLAGGQREASPEAVSVGALSLARHRSGRSPGWFSAGAPVNL